VGGYLYIKNRIYVAPSEPRTELSEEDKIKYKEVDGITNVLLIGTDGRTLDENSRSDAMIIATLDNNNKKIKLTSIMRDTLVDIPGYGEQKINAAFAFGGPELLMETIKNTFEINLDKYIIVNFWGFEAIIDQIGGIDVEIKDYEIENINEYIGESTETKSDPITKPGLQTLNGAQALSYSRIRSVGNASYERSERQRTVINKVAEKLVKVNPLKYPGIANEMSKHIRTNIDPLVGLNYAYTIYKFPTLQVEQLQVPHSLLVEDRLFKDRGWVILMDKKQNAQILHDFVFNDIMPDEDKFDYAQRDSVFAAFKADEARYNSLYGVVPEDHKDDKAPVVDKDKKPNVEKPKEEEKEPEPEAPKPNTKPTITTHGPMTIHVGDAFVQPVITATDKEDGALNVTVSGSVNVNVAGTYTLTYSATDKGGLTATTSVTVTVLAKEPTPPPTPPTTEPNE
ncbi:MAG: LCP family protein, partial [Clostridium sp.]